MWPTGEIVLEKTNKLHAYPSGSVVRGKLVVKVVRPLLSRHHLKVSVKGWGQVNIKKLATWNQNTTYNSSKVYLDLSFFVWRGERENKEQDLAVGIHEFPFELELTQDIPSSYSGKYGSIRYIISAHIQTNKKVIPFGRILALQIRRNIDYSSVYRLPGKLPKYSESAKIKGGLLRSSGEISFTVELPHCGFSVGGPIPLSGTITNSSSSRVSLKAYLVQHVKFTGVGKWLWIVESMQEETKNTLAMVDIGDFPESKSGIYTLYWGCDKFRCPDEITQSGSTEPCDFISVSHYIRVMMIGSGLTVGSTYVDIPVTIGNQPVQEHPTASATLTKTKGGHSLGAGITPSLNTVGHGATPSAPPLSFQAVSKEALAKKSDQSHSAQRYHDEHYHSQETIPNKEGHDADATVHAYQQPPVAAVTPENQALWSVDNLRQPNQETQDDQIPSYDELFPEGCPTLRHGQR